MAAKQSCRHVFCVPYASSVELNKEAQCGRLQEITTGRTSFIEKGISKMAVTFAKSGSDQLIPYHFFNLGCNCSVDHGTEGRGSTPLPPAGAPPLIGEAMSAPLSGEVSAQPTEGFHSCFLIDEAPCIPLRLNNYLGLKAIRHTNTSHGIRDFQFFCDACLLRLRRNQCFQQAFGFDIRFIQIVEQFSMS